MLRIYRSEFRYVPLINDMTLRTKRAASAEVWFIIVYWKGNIVVEKKKSQCRLPGLQKSTDLSGNPLYALNKYKIW